MRPSTSICQILSWVGFLFGSATFAADRAAEMPTPIAVEPQPLGAGIQRVLATLASLGTPLDKPLVSSLEAAIQSRDALKMQELLDPKVLFVLQINPEERVKVRRGPATVALQQHGFTPVLIKIENNSTATKPLRIFSPQSGAVYAGVAKLSMKRQQSPEFIENERTNPKEDRFLEVELFRQPPMTDRLSGLEVEYALALILSTESGKRDATIGFDLGQQEQDLAFRGQTSVLFDIRPAVAVQVSVRDDDGTPTTASLIIRDQHGRVFPLQPKRLAPDFFFQPQIYRADGETILLPPGEFTVQSGRGPEYWTRSQKFVVAAPAASTGTPELEIRLERWTRPIQYGFYSGDHHIHAAGCAHYTQPTEGVAPEDMFRQVKGEGLNVGCVLTWGPCYRHQRQYFSPKPNNISEPLTLLKYDVEVSGFGSQALGHVCLLNLKDQTYPGSEGTDTKGWPTWTTPVMRWAKAQGGIAGYAHSASGLAIEPAGAAKRLISKYDKNADGLISPDEANAALLPEMMNRIDSDGDHQLDERELIASLERVSDQLPNLAVPQMNGVGAMEICVATAEGVCDFISSMDTRRIQEWNTWYHLLNCGFPLKVSGETDFPCMSSTRVGQGRVYVQLEANEVTGKGEVAAGENVALDFGRWCDGLAAGRSYVSDGFAHALDFRVNDIRPGYRNVDLKAAGRVKVTARVAFAPETPLTVAQGTIVPPAGQRLSGDTVELHGPRKDQVVKGGERLVEIVWNGRPIASQKVPADGHEHLLEFDVPVNQSGWIALRQFPQLHTNPVNVIVSQRPIRASRASALWCEQTIDLLWQNREKTIAVAEREEASQTFERAKKKYREIASECEVESPGGTR